MTELAGTTLHYGTTGASKGTDELGMRAMQRRVWAARDAQHLLVKSPPASGKSRAAMFVALDKLHAQRLRKVVVAVPERSIGASFRKTNLTASGFPHDWHLDRDLCGVGSETGGKVRELIDFLQGGEGTTALCTHATLRFAFAQGGLEMFDGCLLCVDELHHASSDENSRLGNLLRGLIDRAGAIGCDAAHVLAMTGSYFRGDGTAVLHPEDEARFEKVVYTYYEQLNGYEYLKTLHIGFRFYQGKYLDAIGEALDPDLKTIIHIPHVGSAEGSGVNKMFAVDAIIDALGDRLGSGATTKTDAKTGFVQLTAGGRTLTIANLVDDGPDRDIVLASLRAVRDRDDVDVIIALGMAKEGFDWVWCEHVLTVGYRGSLTEVVQIIGRATRDAPGKTEAHFTNLVSAPFANDEAISRAVNDMLKAISVSLLMEQVMAPVFKFRTSKGADGFDGSPGDASKPGAVTNAGEIEVIGMPEVDEKAAEAIETDFNDLFADVQNDPRTLTVMINPDDHHTDVIYDMVVTDVIQRRYPSFSEDQVRDATTLFGVRTGLAQELLKDPSIVQTDGFSAGNQAPFDLSGAGSPGAEVTEEQDDPKGTAGDRFVRDARRFVDVRELQVDLLGDRRDFEDAYELLSKALSEELLARLHGEVRALKISMSQEEAEKLLPRIKEFIQREGREPNLNAPNGREVRLADALAFLRKLSRQKRNEMAGADAVGPRGMGTRRTSLMPEAEEIDYLNDPLLQSPDEKPKAARTPIIDRALETLQRIEAFLRETGTEPISEPGRSVRERMLANELAGLRASREVLAGLEQFDTSSMIFNGRSDTDPLDDPLLTDGIGIFNVRDELKPVARPDYVADRRPCPDFERFETTFERVRRGVENGARKPQPFHQERVDLGEFFVLKGQLVHVADVRDEHERNGKPDARLRVIFDNGTESNLLMSSLVRRLYEDKDARRIGTTDVGPLFEGVCTGFVYILRSRSNRSEVEGLLKIGTTSGSVEDRIARAETQSTFLFAPVEIVETYELVGHSAKEAEQRIHRALRSYHVALKVTGPDGRTFSATEWFKASSEMIEAAVQRVLRIER